MEFKTELQFQKVVTDLFIANGWFVYCHPDSRASISFSSPGFPDIVATKRGLILFAECKLPSKTPSKKQHGWLNALSRCPGVEVHIWRPKDLPRVETLVKRQLR